MSAITALGGAKASELYLGQSSAAALPDPTTVPAGGWYRISGPGTNHTITWADGDKAISNGTVYANDPKPVIPVEEGGTGDSDEDGAAENLDYYRKGAVEERQLSKARTNALDFSRSPAYLDYGDADEFSHTDGNGNDRAFSVLMRVKVNSFVNQTFFRKYGSAGSREYICQTQGDGAMRMFLVDSANREVFNAIGSLNSFAGKWVDIVIVVDPVSAFASRADDISFFVNALSRASESKQQNASYSGMANTGQSFLWGSSVGNTDFQMAIGLMYNRALQSSEIADFTKDGVIPRKDRYGKNDIQVNGDFSADSNWNKGAGWSIGGGVASCASGSTDIQQSVLNNIEVGQQVRITFDVLNYVSGTVTPLAGAATGTARSANGTYSEVLTWTSGSNLAFRSASFVGDIDNVQVEKLGVVLAVLPEYIQSDGGVLDPTPEENNGLPTNVVPLQDKVQESADFTPTLTFGGGSSNMAFAANGQQGRWTKTGEKIRHVEMRFTLTAKGDSTGSAVIGALPFTTKNHGGTVNTATVSIVAKNMTGLTGVVQCEVRANHTTLNLLQTSAAGAVVIDHSVFTDTTQLLVSFDCETE